MDIDFLDDEDIEHQEEIVGLTAYPSGVKDIQDLFEKFSSEEPLYARVDIFR